MRRLLGLAALLSLVAILAADATAVEPRRPGAGKPAASKDQSSPGKTEGAKPTMPQSGVTLTDGRLTIQVQDRPLEWVLEEISRRARIAIVRAAGVGRERVSLELRDLP